MARRRSGCISIDISEVIDQIDDEDLVNEVQSRKLIVGGSSSDFVPEYDLREAYEELLRGRPSEALSILHRLIFPKWSNVKAAQRELDRAKS